MADWFPLILYILGAILVVVLIWAFIEFALTIRRTRTTVKNLDPTIEKVNSIIASLEPSSKRIDPLLERVSLTVDAVNLEIMRADQILSDVSDVTGTLSGTITKVTDITDAPLNLLSSAADKVRDIFTGKKSTAEPAEGLMAKASENRDVSTSTGQVDDVHEPESAERPNDVDGSAPKEQVATRKISGSGYFNYPQTTPAKMSDDAISAVEDELDVDASRSGKADPVDFNPDVS